MGGEWREVRVEDIAEKLASGPFGSNLRGKEYTDEGVPVIRGNNLTGPRFTDRDYVYVSDQKADQLRASLAYPFDIVFAARGTVGAVGIVTKGRFSRFLLSSNLVKVTVDQAKADPHFVFYYFRSADGQNEILAHVNTTGVPKIERALESLRRFRINLPPLPEQRAIAHILGTLDDKIELNRRMSQTLEEMARAIFKSWFVDFDPVRAKAAVRREHPDWTNAQVSRAACPNLKPEIAELFPYRLVDSELGEIPEGWRVGALGNVADVNWGDTNVTKKSYVEHGFLAYSAKGPDGFLPYYDYDRTGVVLSAIGANSGFTWLAQGKWSCIKNTIRFWCTDESLSTEYLFYATLGKHHWPLRGSAQPFVSQEDARNVLILKPSENLGNEFGNIVRPLLEKSNLISVENVTLASLRDALLPKLISGEIRVKDAEKFLEKRGL